MLARVLGASKLAPSPTHMHDNAQHPYLKPRKYNHFFLKEKYTNKQRQTPTHSPRAARTLLMSQSFDYERIN